MAFAHDLLVALRPALLVEVGSLSGESYFGFCQTVVEHGLDCVCYGIQPSLTERLLYYNATHYGAFSHLMEDCNAIRGFSDDSIGLLHIHTGSVFEAWFPKVKPGGFVLIAGIGKRDSDNDSWKVWERIETMFSERFSFHHADGLGILRKPGGDALNLQFPRHLFESSPEMQEYIRRHYVIYSGYLERILQADAGVQTLMTELQAAQHERMFLETELKETQFQRNEARRTADRMQALADRTQALADRAQAESVAKHDELQKEIERLNEILRSERQVVHSLMNSLSWKVTAPLRSVMELIRTRGK